MMKTFQVHQQVTTATSTTATLQIPTGGKIHQIFLRFSDSTNSDASCTETEIRAEVTGNIRLSLGGIDVVNVLAVRLLDIYKMFGNKLGKTATLTVGGMPLNIAPFMYVDPAARDLVGWGTANVNSIQVQVGMGTVDDCNRLQSFSSREPKNENLGTYGKLVDYPRNFNAQAVDTIDTLPRNLNSAYLALFVNLGASGVAASSEVRVNAAPIREKVPFHTNILWNATFGYDTDAAAASGEGVYFTHLFCQGGIDQYLPMKNVTDLRVLTDFSAAVGGVAPGAAGYTATPLTLENFLGV